MTDFVLPDWSKPLDLAERLAAVPPSLMVRGIFFNTPVGEARARAGRSPGQPSYSPFGNYPVRELIEVLAGCAPLVHPNLRPRESLRRLGNGVFPELRESMAGRLLFSVAGNNFVGAVNLIGKAYALFSGAEAKVVEVGERSAVIAIRNVWTFPDCYHVGVMEGAMRYYGKSGKVEVRARSLCDIDLRFTW